MYYLHMYVLLIVIPTAQTSHCNPVLVLEISQQRIHKDNCYESIVIITIFCFILSPQSITGIHFDKRYNIKHHKNPNFRKSNPNDFATNFSDHYLY